MSGGLKINQPRFNQARLGAMRQTTKPGGPLMETGAKKKAKKDTCAKFPHLTSQDTPNQKTPSPRRLAGQARNRRRLQWRVPFRRRPQWPVPRGAQLPTRKRGVSTRRASLAPHDAPTCRAPTSHRAKRAVLVACRRRANPRRTKRPRARNPSRSAARLESRLQKRPRNAALSQQMPRRWQWRLIRHKQQPRRVLRIPPPPPQTRR